MANSNFKQANILGEKAWNVFEDSQGNLIKEECTLDEYKSLALPNPTNPTKDGHLWRYSYTDWHYDTPSGRLEDGHFAVQPNGKVVAKRANKDQENHEDLETFLKGEKDGNSL